MNGVLDHYKPYHFLKSGIRTFRCVYLNCFNKLSFLSEVSTKLQKVHFFGHYKGHNSERKRGNETNDPFFIYFFHSNCLQHSFWYFKIVKIHFYVVPPLVDSSLQDTSILDKNYLFGQPIIFF